MKSFNRRVALAPPLISIVLLACACAFGESQINIAKVELMPNHPSPYLMRNWREVAHNYDAFVFDFTKTGDYLPLIWWDTTQYNFPRDGFGMPSYVGRPNQTGGTAHESVNCMGAVLGATLAGIDKSDQNGNNWVLMEENYFNIANGQNLYLNNIGGVTGGSFWYELLPNVLFYQLLHYYPGTGNMESEFITVANRWYDACVAMGGSASPWTVPNFNHTAFNFSTMTPVDNGVWLEPDSAAAIGWIEYIAYLKTGAPNYLDAADWSMQYLEGRTTNPLYDLLFCFAPYIAVRMNIEQGRSYNVDKFINWCFNGNQNGWGVHAENWGGYDCDGLVSSSTYAFNMETLNFAGALVPIVRYDQRYARAIGKWMLNLANSVRLFYPNSLPDDHQTCAAWAHTYDPDYCIGYEGLKKERVDYNKAQSETTVYGSITSGNYTTTHLRDNAYEVLEEEALAGEADGLEHIWEIPLTEGYFDQIVIKSHITDSGDADNGFNFSYATDPNGPYTYLFTVTSTTDVFKWQAISVSGTVYLKVEDTNRTGGNLLLDRIYIDEIYIHTQNNTISPYASGDPLTWGWGPTDLGLYGSSYIGILGGIVSTTNVEEILQLDLLKTDYYRDDAFPTYLYFNPYDTNQVVDVNVGPETVDIYDTISKVFLRTNVTGVTSITVPADSVVVAVFAHADGIVTQTGDKKYINGIVVDYRANQTYETCAQVQASPYRLPADLDRDCAVGLGDLEKWVQQWLEYNQLIPPVPPVQISSFDNLAAEGWYETRSTGYMEQSSVEVAEGTGSMRIKFEEFTDLLWDEVPEKTFSPPNLLDLTPVELKALSFWVWSDLVGVNRVRQLIVYRAAGTARFDIPTATAPGWRKILCPVDDFYWRADWGDSPVTDFSEIDRINFWCSTYQTPGNSIYIDDLRLEDFSESVTCQDIQQSAYRLIADLNGSCDVNWPDFALFANDWQNCNDPQDPNCTPNW